MLPLLHQVYLRKLLVVCLFNFPQVDGIWHSGVVIRGREYFFGYGIHIEPAGKTMFGTPTQILELG